MPQQPDSRRPGIRTPATLASDEAWRIGHRAGGPAIVVAGLIMIICGMVAALAAAGAAPTAAAATASVTMRRLGEGTI